MSEMYAFPMTTLILKVSEGLDGWPQNVGGTRYNCAVADPRRDDFPNHFVGDLVKTHRGWVVVPPTCCPGGHDYGDDGWSVSSVWCSCNGRHMAWRCLK